MPLKFDKYVNNYTVEIAEDVTKLEIDYKKFTKENGRLL